MMKLRAVAKSRLLAGPAREMRAVSRLGVARLYGSKTTGLAQPKPVKIISRVPSGSR